ncbi:MAG: sodium pump decarboxylase subunit gamma [Spirochaetaceae bacterium]|nr:MAG: sodium pump decarboxylase subunit gamma [Spirochaetaceae bacterium]
MSAGITLMIVGMTVVFSFLVVQVLATMFMSAIVTRLLPEVEPEPASNHPTDDNNRIAVAIAAAFKIRNSGEC